MLRPSAHVLVIAMLLTSGRLLACGLECLDELALPTAASCHQQSAPDAALNDDGAHACLPETAEPSVRVAKPASAQSLMAAPPAVQLAADHFAAGTPFQHHRSSPPRFGSPHAPAFSVLRI